MDKILQIQALTKELNQCRHEYYNLNKPTVADSVYDKLFDRLQLLEKETGYMLANSPTQTVGYDAISKLQKRTHPTPLKSLSKTKSIDELIKWAGDKDVLLMLKLDGLTIEIVYENGKLTGGYTRGNGEIGEDVTHNCKVFKNLPLSIPFKGKLRIVGEAIIYTNNFDKDSYATSRNLCAGSVRQLNSEVCAERNVYFYAFSVLECSEELPDSKSEILKFLCRNGIAVVACHKLKISQDSIDAMVSFADLNFIPIDGIVVTFDSVTYSETLPETSHHPNHSIAFKFDDEVEETILRNVEWNTTRTGQINPTAIFDTVTLDNTEVSRASLHNLSFIQNLSLNIGCRILVSKRNMIIPHIEDNLDKSNGILPIPIICPSCNHKTYIENTGTADFLFCKNKQCPAQLLDRFVHFSKRDAMNIEGMSEATIKKFINMGLLKTFADIYNLEQYKDKITNMEGWGIKSYNNLIKAINKTRKIKLNNFIYALGIPNIGRSASKAIAKHFGGSWWKFEFALVDGFDFTALEDFGPIMNKALHNWYEDNDEAKLWEWMPYNIIKFIKDEEKIVSDNPIAGKKIYCTGTFASYKKNELKEIVEKLGATFGSGYAKNLDLLVEGSLKSSTKVDKAKRDGVPVIGEVEFLKMMAIAK